MAVRDELSDPSAHGNARRADQTHQHRCHHRNGDGVPTEIVEVTDDIIANTHKYAAIIGERVSFDDALDAIKLAQTPAAAEKIVITWP